MSGGQPTDTEAGFQFRNDNIPSVGLYHTEARQILGTFQRDPVTETSEAFYLQNKTLWSPVVRTMVGVRQDLYQIGVNANLPANSGRATGCEAGVRTAIIPAWQSTLAVFRLDLGSELVFDADDGTTAPSGPTRRVGVEWNNEFHAMDRLTITADGAMTRARYTDFEPLGDYVPEAIN